MNFFEELKWRGLVKDVTDEEGLKDRLKSPLTCYCGFDPTGDSLHVGHLQQILLLKRYQMQGHRPIALCGGATAMIGDPRPTTERALQSLDTIALNAESIKKQLAHFLDFEGDNNALMVNNHDWLSKITVLDFLRDYGKYFNVNYMINKDIVASRLDSGISYTEFSYTILQAADFLHLYETYDCQLQIGGSDQWGNLTSGCELIRKVKSEAKVYGITSPLITRSDGSKFGKSEGGKSVWLNPKRTNSYEFYQFWLNTPDSDIGDYLKRLSFKSIDEIIEIIDNQMKQPHLRIAQKALAEELTLLVFDQSGLDKALKITETLFGGDIRSLSSSELKDGLYDAPKTVLSEDCELTDLLLLTNIAKSKREARELINNNSISVNGLKINEPTTMIKKEDAIDKELTVIKKGKKYYYIVEFK
ncbi:MAG: tyrosine--tRNA ligase [Erysipelotrichaceae bacterium]|nr:tyrosine--tRNA ligase [Erysipelotrichaceae bacterium]MDD3923609.1 tyrosine--tRNA ligase [Erysipelotrichaceae bacterium]MDD4642479.1 tyrosine--tRNA ligase [Erysipelotrichaceae bacterium]